MDTMIHKKASSRHQVNAFSLNPYKWAVKTTIIRGFNELNNGNYHYFVDLMTADVQYKFEGDHTLGGTRTSKAGVVKWFERLLRLLPGQFQIKSINIVGPVWRTTVITTFTDTVYPLFGAAYSNNGVQIAHLKFGKVYQVHTYVNTAKVINALNVLYEHGIAEAKAAMIEY